jgi:hypothetical protein
MPCGEGCWLFHLGPTVLALPCLGQGVGSVAVRQGWWRPGTWPVQRNAQPSPAQRCHGAHGWPLPLVAQDVYLWRGR